LAAECQILGVRQSDIIQATFVFRQTMRHNTVVSYRARWHVGRRSRFCRFKHLGKYSFSV